MSFVLSRWFPEVQNIYYQGNKKKQLPTGDSSAKLDSFFNCAATLMTLQLQDLTLVSMQDFTNLIAQPRVRIAQLSSRAFHSGFPILSERKPAQDSCSNETAASISSDPLHSRAERLGQLAQSG